MIVAEWFVRVLTLYAALGVGFGVLFVVAGVQRIDPVARNTGLGFRLIIFPGSAALWPALLIRWIRS